MTHSFPTRRSSDLPDWPPELLQPGSMVFIMPARITRSEEHTSELQSLMRISYAVFCLKKKTTKTKKYITHTTTTDSTYDNMRMRNHNNINHQQNEYAKRTYSKHENYNNTQR